MKIFAALFCATLIAATIGASVAQAKIIDRRKQCGKWEYIPASEQLGNPDTALLFCEEEDRTWMALKIECLADEKRMAISYRPGFTFVPPAIEVPEVQDAVATEDLIPEEIEAHLIDSIPLETATQMNLEPEYPNVPREMVFFDFRSFGYTSVAYYLAANSEWKFFEPEPMSAMFQKLISGSFADIKLLATDATERFPLRGSGKALRPVVEACRLAKKG